MRQLTTGILIVFYVPFIVCQSDEAFYDKALEKMEIEDYQYAAVMIDKAIHLNDTNFWFWLKKAEIATALHDPHLTIGCIKKAIEIDSTKSEPYNRAGSFYESLAVADSSICMYNKAIKLATSDTLKFYYLQNRGSVKAKTRDFEGARIDLERVLEFDANDLGALNNIAPVYRQLNMPNKAIDCLEKVISLDSSWVGPYINLGFAYSALDSFDLAIAFFNQALVLEPDQPLVYSNRGHTYYKIGEYGKAINDINKSISLYPTNSYAYRNLALVYLALDGKNEACNALDYASYYGFTVRYGNEVDELIVEHCKN